MLRYDEIQSLNIKKGDVIEWSNCKNGKTRKGTVLDKRVKTVSGGKYFCGTRNRWIDAGPVKQVHFRIKDSELDITFAEETFHLLKKINTSNFLSLIEGQTAEELMFNWTLKELRDFAKELNITKRGAMNKAQLAMSIEREVHI